MNEWQEKFYEYAAANGMDKLSKEELQAVAVHFCAGWKASDEAWQADIREVQKSK